MIESITVIIPTCRRPLMLQAALASVERQSYKHLIQEVLVSENSDCEMSKSVALEFADSLPIHWIQQDPPVEVNSHALRLSCLPKSSHIALLADDDMWDRYHIEEAFRAFSEIPKIAAFFGQAVVVENSNCQILQHFNRTFDQLDRGDASPLEDFRIWDQPIVAMNQISSTLNIWSLVATNQAYRDAIERTISHPVLGSFPSADVLLVWRLSYHGVLAVGRHVSLFYRRHPSSHVQTVMRTQRALTQAQALLVREEICNQAKLLNIDALRLWRKANAALEEQGLKGGLPPMDRKHFLWLKYAGSRAYKIRLLMDPVFQICVFLADNAMPPIIPKLFAKVRRLPLSWRRRH